MLEKKQFPFLRKGSLPIKHLESGDLNNHNEETRKRLAALPEETTDYFFSILRGIKKKNPRKEISLYDINYVLQKLEEVHSTSSEKRHESANINIVAGTLSRGKIREKLKTFEKENHQVFITIKEKRSLLSSYFDITIKGEVKYVNDAVEWLEDKPKE